VESHAVISHDVLASYAADAAVGVEGVQSLVDAPRRHRGVKVGEEGGTVTVEVNVVLEWGARAQEVGTVVQQRVTEYLRRTAKVDAVSVDVVVAAVAAPSSG
jgi:uncharacterized alkaline shock family protein YloU